MKNFKISIVASAAFVTTLLCLQPQMARAGGQGYSKDVLDTSKDIGLGKFSSSNFHVAVTVRGGYDDNVNLTQFNEQDSFFTSVNLGVTYDFGSPRTRINLNSGVGFTWFADRDSQFSDSDNFDLNLYLGLGISHKVTPRWTLSANLYAAYVSQPDFQSFNAGANFFGRQNQDFFFTVNKFNSTYLWTPRFSTSSSFTIGYTNYDDEAVSVFQDRVELTSGTEFRFLVMPTTTVVAEYRIGSVIYSETDDRDSTSFFLLGGFDHSFSPRFNISFRGGVEFREYDEDGGVFGFAQDDDNLTSPYGELTLNYAIAQNTALSWTNRYSIEESDVPELRSRRTFRTAASLRHGFTSRITGGINVAYQNDDYDDNLLFSGFTEDSFDIALSVRYAINRNWSVDVGYDHTEVVSDEALFRSYSRNRVYGGVTFTF